ncbi:MAG TPA: acyl-CoA dehydrogenase family protein [Microbacteriaceae bacterium]|nr:acyl-CoA dehydrogenase family protein [Microbacteriaceae bacterium]
MTLNVERVFDFAALVTPEEREWQLKARRFATEHIAPVVEDDFDTKFFRRELIAKIAEAGFLGMHIKGYGCAGASAVAYGLVCHELEAVDSAWRTFVSVQGSLAMSAINKHGTEEQKQHYLPKMAKGEIIGCFGLTEPHGGSDPADMRTTARRDGDSWVLNGAKRWIGLGSIADIAIIWALADDGLVRGFIVPTSSEGYHAENIDGKLAMRNSVQCDITLTDVRIPADNLLPETTGLKAPFMCLNEARYGITWGAMGAARTCIEAAIERSSSREVFGSPIAGYQITQTKLADMFVEYEKGMLLSLYIGQLKDAGKLAPFQISVGKLNSVREAISIASQARTILGGDGITNAYPVMRIMANLEAVRTYEGTDEIHQLVLGRELTGIAAFA